jgi:CDP-diacylglycerol---serine O-phosphatidyltransferase
MNDVLKRRHDDLRQRKQRKGMYLLPSMFTAGNMFLGFWAILQALQGSIAEPRHFDNAAMAIGFAVVFDGLDGAIARMTNTTSDFGKELDSLADVITFGVAPAVLAWMWGFHELPVAASPELLNRLRQIGTLCSFLFLVAGAARLARFNIQLNPQPMNPGRPGKKYFVGMPIPGGAGCLAAVVHFWVGVPLSAWWMSALWCAFVAFCGFLMVSTWRFWSSKNIDWKSRQSFRYLILLSAIVCGIFLFSRYVLIALALAYMISGVLTRLTYRRSSVARAPQHSPEVS